MSAPDPQADFLRRGGPLAGVLAQKYERGELVSDTPYYEYPKMLRFDHGRKTVHRSTEKIVGNTTRIIEWDEEIDDIEEVIVKSEEEEERVLSGGKTAAQVETDRQDMLAEAKRRGLSVDPTWGLVRLQRELGAAPTSEAVDALRAKVADLEEKAELRRRIAELESQISGKTPAPDEAEGLRQELRALGIEPDGRWGMGKLRAELEKATAPRE